MPLPAAILAFVAREGIKRAAQKYGPYAALIARKMFVKKSKKISDKIKQAKQKKDSSRKDLDEQIIQTDKKNNIHSRKKLGFAFEEYLRWGKKLIDLQKQFESIRTKKTQPIIDPKKPNKPFPFKDWKKEAADEFKKFKEDAENALDDQVLNAPNMGRLNKKIDEFTSELKRRKAERPARMKEIDLEARRKWERDYPDKPLPPLHPWKQAEYEEYVRGVEGQEARREDKEEKQRLRASKKIWSKKQKERFTKPWKQHWLNDEKGGREMTEEEWRDYYPEEYKKWEREHKPPGDELDRLERKDFVRGNLDRIKRQKKSVSEFRVLAGEESDVRSLPHNYSQRSVDKDMNTQDEGLTTKDVLRGGPTSRHLMNAPVAATVVAGGVAAALLKKKKKQQQVEEPPLAKDFPEWGE